MPSVFTYWNKILDNIHVWEWVDLDSFVEVRINTAKGNINELYIIQTNRIS